VQGKAESPIQRPDSMRGVVIDRERALLLARVVTGLIGLDQPNSESVVGRGNDVIGMPLALGHLVPAVLAVPLGQGVIFRVHLGKTLAPKMRPRLVARHITAGAET